MGALPQTHEIFRPKNLSGQELTRPDPATMRCLSFPVESHVRNPQNQELRSSFVSLEPRVTSEGSWKKLNPTVPVAGRAKRSATSRRCFCCGTSPGQATGGSSSGDQIEVFLRRKKQAALTVTTFSLQEHHQQKPSISAPPNLRTTQVALYTTFQLGVLGACHGVPWER